MRKTGTTALKLHPLVLYVPVDPYVCYMHKCELSYMCPGHDQVDPYVCMF